MKKKTTDKIYNRRKKKIKKKEKKIADNLAKHRVYKIISN